MSNIQTIGVVGAGLMGAGIAQVLATVGYQIILNDQSEDALAAAQTSIAARMDRLAEKGQLSVEEAAAAKARLRISSDLSSMSSAQMVIEAIIERLDIKQALFQRLESIVQDDTVLASNTSSLLIAAIGNGCKLPGRICGLHFFNPVPLMKLVEVIPGPFTYPDVVDAALALVKRMGKVPVLAKDSPGFLVNLGGRAFYTEALHIEAEGVATPDQIDRIMKGAAGFRMGPFELMDLTGIDTNYPVTTFIHERFQGDPRLRTTPLHGYMVESGRYGRKSNLGFYDYSVDRSVPQTSPQKGPATALAAVIPAVHPGFDVLAEHGLTRCDDDGVAPILVSPMGEDATGIAYRLSLDPGRTVAVDFTGINQGIVTVMTPPGVSRVLDSVVEWLTGAGLTAEVVADSPGFVAPRIIAMIINLCCEIAQMSIASPDDIGTAMQLGLNYPFDPLERGDQIGAPAVLQTLSEIQATTGFDRYRPSLWLRRRALTGLSLKTR